MLTREEAHKRVDALFDAIEKHYDEDAIAVIGRVVGSVNLNAPSAKKDYYRIRGTVGYAPFTFSKLEVDNGLSRVRSRTSSGLFGTLVVPRSDLSDVVQRALDGDKEAIHQLQSGVGERRAEQL